LIKFENILPEIGINKPITKKEILDYITTSDQDGYALIQNLYLYDNYKYYMKDLGDSIENPSENDKYAKLYYDNFTIKDIYVFEVEDSAEDAFDLPYLYKYCITLGLGYNNALIILHNIK